MDVKSKAAAYAAEAIATRNAVLLTAAIELLQIAIRYETNLLTQIELTRIKESYECSLLLYDAGEVSDRNGYDGHSSISSPPLSPITQAPSTTNASFAFTDSDSDSDSVSDDSDSSSPRFAITQPDNTRWNDVIGLEDAKRAMKEAVLLPKRFPHLFTGARKPWDGILLYGPPGTGKSHLAKALTGECESSFLAVSSSDIVSKWQGESARAVRALFEQARKQRDTVVFIDEVDALAGARTDGENDEARRIKTELLVQMQGVHGSGSGSGSRVTVIAATNTPWTLDPAFRRRFQKRIYVPLPDEPARKDMIRLHLGSSIEHELVDEDFAHLASITNGYSGADISILVRDAVMGPLRRCQASSRFSQRLETGKYFLDESVKGGGNVNITLEEIPDGDLEVPRVLREDFLMAASRNKPSVSGSELGRFLSWTEKFGST